MISVCMATYNGERYIKEQIDSILCQLSEDDELIVSDDHSTDSTCVIIKSYNDNRIKLFMNELEKVSLIILKMPFYTLVVILYFSPIKMMFGFRINYAS